MAKRIGFWALGGFTVAFLWFLYFYWLTYDAYHGGPGFDFSSTTEALVNFTAPVRPLLGRHHAITWYWSLPLNAGIYACVGLTMETIRMAVRSSVLRPHH
jgi:hypothetical protein